MVPSGEDDERALVEWAFRQASFSMSVFDVEQRYLRLNEVAGQVMGVAEDVLRGQAFPYGIPADVDHLGTLQALRDVAATGKPAHYESYSRAPSGLREQAWNLELWPVRNAAGEVCAVGMAGFDSLGKTIWAEQALTSTTAA
ncbi:PAS domain-containing protein [Streptomyces sp. NPDC050619]|uniref:PAS domain-containing protein n=1 Tax=Streptomyces sp. NPDC050619 TaxID=3157214 RepID=UPI00342BC5B5